MNSSQTRRFAALFLLHAFQTGIFAPVISLYFLSKGIRLSELAILMGVFSGTVLILEVPTGILADLFGRKRTFLLSILFSAASVLFFYFSQNILIIGLGVLLYGIGRALSSGSMEALFIDRVVAEDGKDGLATASARLNIFDSLGLTCGSVIGGFLPSLCRKLPFFATPYDLNLILRFLITLSVGVLTVACIEDSFVKSEEKGGWQLLKDHLRLSAELLRKDTKLIVLFLSVSTTGVFFFSVETYWQPQFKKILPDDSFLWALGIVSFFYFASALAGTLISKKLLKTKKIKAGVLYPAARLLLALALFLLALQKQIPGFVVFFALVYLFLGVANTPESVLINERIPSRYRASILSMNSLILQLGALGTSVVSAGFLTEGNIPVLWFSAAALLAAACILLIFLFRNKTRKSSKGGIENETHTT